MKSWEERRKEGKLTVDETVERAPELAAVLSTYADDEPDEDLADHLREAVFSLMALKTEVEELTRALEESGPDTDWNND